MAAGGGERIAALPLPADVIAPGSEMSILSGTINLGINYESPRASSAMLWLPAVLGSLAVAYLWKFRFAAEYMPGDQGTYIVGPLLWFIAGVIAFMAWCSTSDGEHEQKITVLAFILGLFTVAVTVLVGIYAGTGLSPYAHTPRWLVTNLAFAGAPLVATEIARSYIIRLFGRRAILGIGVTAVAGAALVFSYQQLLMARSSEGNAEFYGARFLPELSSNLLASFLSWLGGPLASIAYRGTIEFYEWYAPYLADPPWLTAAFVGVATPAIALWVVESLANRTEGEESEATSSRFGAPSTAWMITASVSLALLWFSLGFFSIKPSFVPSHSMEPSISPGSIVITRDVAAEDIEVGDVVLYRLGREAVLHRVIARWPNGTFTTQGDANNTADPQAVQPAQIEGRLMFDIPHLGWGPIWVGRTVNKVLGR